MSTRKLQRMVRAAIRTAGCGVIKFDTPGGHYHYTLRLPNGAQRKLVVACSPAIFESSLKCAIKDIQRFIAETPPPPTA